MVCLSHLLPVSGISHGFGQNGEIEKEKRKKREKNCVHSKIFLSNWVYYIAFKVEYPITRQTPPATTRVVKDQTPLNPKPDKGINHGLNLRNQWRDSLPTLEASSFGAFYSATYSTFHVKKHPTYMSLMG